MKPIAVIGAGAFGTALAIAFATTGRPVFLWARDPDHAQEMQAGRENQRRLKHCPFPVSLKPISDLQQMPMDAVQVLAIPAQQTGVFLAENHAKLPDAPMVLAAKGIDQQTGALQSEIVRSLLPNRRLTILSGPGFAHEIARGMPTALSFACRDKVLGAQLQERLSTPTLRLYLSGDLIGVQLGGALKNVVALACGMCAGAGLGESARAALMTRGYAEILRLGVAMGAEVETFSGLSGLGDLALSCNGLQSRNYAAGHALGKARSINSNDTVEGIATARAVLSLATKYNVDMPIALAVTHVLDGTLGINAVMQQLLSRPLKEETATPAGKADR